MTLYFQIKTKSGDFDSRLFFPAVLGATASESGVGDFDKETHTYQSAFVDYDYNGAQYRVRVEGTDLALGRHNDIKGDISGGQVREVIDGKLVTIANVFVGHAETPGAGSIPIQSLASLTPDTLLAQVEKEEVEGLRVYGENGNDKLYGSSSGDLLSGQGGNDVLTGYAGDDEFAFAKPGKVTADHVTDFTHGQDKIVIIPSFRNPFGDLTINSDLGKVFHDITNSAEQKDDRILYDSSTGTLSFDADGSGKDVPVVFAYLDNHAKLDFHDFVIWL